MKKIEIKYKENTRPAKAGVDKGTTKSVLKYYEDIYKNIFSSNFLAKPNSRDIKEFADNRKITWEIQNKNMQAVSSIDESIIAKLEEQKNKLAAEISQLYNKINSTQSTQGDKDRLEILSQFSFNWDDPNPEHIYCDGENITILSWGMTDTKGIVRPIPTVPGLDPQGPELEPDPDPQGPELEPYPQATSFFDKLKEWFEKQDWKRILLISLLILILLLLLKNCAPNAEINDIQDGNTYLSFSSENSHDATSFFSRGLLSEDSKADLIKKWYLYKKNDFSKDEDLAYEKYLYTEVGDNYHFEKVNGEYILKLVVEDSGNRLGFWAREDQFSLQFNIKGVVLDTPIYRVIVPPIISPESPIGIIDTVEVIPLIISGIGPVEPAGGTGSDDGGTGSDDGGTGSDDGGTGSDDGGTGSDDGGTGSDDGGTGSDDGGTDGGLDDERLAPGETVEVKFEIEDQMGLVDEYSGWTKHIRKKRNTESENWKIMRIYFTNPKGIEYEKLPTLPNI